MACRVFVLTQDEPFYLPDFVFNTIKLFKKNDIDVVGVNLSRLSFLKGPSLFRLVNYYRYFGFKSFFKYSVLFVWRMMLALTKISYITGNWYSIRSVSSFFSVAVYSKKKWYGISSIKSCDLVISIAHPDIIRKNELDLIKIPIINFHTGFLPRYRGGAPIFWSMMNNESETAFTVHLVDEYVDGGAIIIQRVISINKSDTLHSMYNKARLIGPVLLNKSVLMIVNSQENFTKNDSMKATIYPIPVAQDGARFRAKGLRFI